MKPALHGQVPDAGIDPQHQPGCVRRQRQVKLDLSGGASTCMYLTVVKYRAFILPHPRRPYCCHPVTVARWLSDNVHDNSAAYAKAKNPRNRVRPLCLQTTHSSHKQLKATHSSKDQKEPRDIRSVYCDEREWHATTKRHLFSRCLKMKASTSLTLCSHSSLSL
jgi:hypothetical protein